VLKKIESLTKDQEKQLDVYRDKWIKIGLSCEPCNFEESKKYAIIAYEAAGLEPPKDFYHVKGPKECIELLQTLDKEVKSSRECSFIYGSHDASWLAFYDYCHEVLGIDCSPVEGVSGVAKNCGWWVAYDDFVIFQDRHCVLKTNDVGLHCEDGPAVEYPDGFKVWAINGVRLTEQIIMHPETLTVQQIDSEQDLDKKSIMIERFGWHNYLSEINAECLDFRNNDIENTKEALYNTEEHGRRLVVTCPTGRMFTLGVPSDITSCHAAQQWLGRGQGFNVIGRT
jgi:hypothetical protein